MAYEGERAMFEAYGRNKYTSTGVIQWMLNNAWPSMIWHLYDYYLRPGGGYFGAKKALQPLNPVYDTTTIPCGWSAASTVDAKGLKVTARVLNLDGTQKFSKDTTLDAPADSTAKAFEIPPIEGLSPAYFLDLRVTDASGKTGWVELLLALHEAGNARLGEIELVRDPDHIVCGLYFARPVTAGEAQGHQSDGTQRGGIGDPGHSR